MMDAIATPRAKAQALAAVFAQSAAEHDRTAQFPFANFDQLSDAGLLALTAPRAYGGTGVGIRESAAVVQAIARGEPATALVLAMQYIQLAAIGRQARWPAHLATRIVEEAATSVSLINALRVEPDLGSPSRGGLPATTARRDGDGWVLSGRKIYSTGAPILRWYVVWARTDEPEPRIGVFLVSADAPGIEIVETWNHTGLRASGSHDVVFDDVAIPFDHAIDLRRPAEWATPDAHFTPQGLYISAIYQGVAEAARDWIVSFLHDRTPSSLGAPLATLPRVQEIVGDIDVRLRVNARLISTTADDFDAGASVSANEVAAVKLTVTNNAVAIVESALSLSGNHGLSRNNPLERHYRDVLCGRVHTPQDDSIRLAYGRAAFNL